MSSSALQLTLELAVLSRIVGKHGQPEYVNLIVSPRLYVCLFASFCVLKSTRKKENMKISSVWSRLLCRSMSVVNFDVTKMVGRRHSLSKLCAGSLALIIDRYMICQLSFDRWSCTQGFESYFECKIAAKRRCRTCHSRGLIASSHQLFNYRTEVVWD